MKRKRHTEEQIIAILKEHEAGLKTADLCRSPAPQASAGASVGGGNQSPGRHPTARRTPRRASYVISTVRALLNYASSSRRSNGSIWSASRPGRAGRMRA
jgi:hypothetical protein